MFYNIINLKIKAVTNIIPKGIEDTVYGQTVYLIVNPETFSDLWEEVFGVEWNRKIRL